MLGNYRVYDADAHVILAPAMWEDLPEKYVLRRPRPAIINDSGDMVTYTSGWMVEGRVEPHVLGPGLQPGNTPAWVVEGRDRGSHTLMNPGARVRDLDQMGIDVQFLFPSTLYARMTADPGFEAAMYRAYNRYMGRQCRFSPKRLKWAGLVPLREPGEAVAALEEMVDLGASAVVVFGTARDKMLSDPSITPLWDEFARTKLPLCAPSGSCKTYAIREGDGELNKCCASTLEAYFQPLASRWNFFKPVYFTPYLAYISSIKPL